MGSITTQDKPILTPTLTLKERVIGPAGLVQIRRDSKERLRQRKSSAYSGRTNYSFPPTACVNALRIASGLFMMFMKLLLPIMDRSGKLIAMRNRA